MKKIIFIILIGVSLFLTACDDTPPDNGNKPPYYHPLTPVEDSLVPTLPDNWVCVFADEFNGSELDETKWNFDNGGDGGGNGELQYYRKENLTVNEGIMTITAKKESYSGKNYTSSRINTKFKGVFKYGRFQASIKVPAGKGTWPAFWMMPTSNKYGGWPNSGEIDIMEYVGYQPDKIYGTVHTTKNNHASQGSAGGLGSSITDNTVTSMFHLYELLWEPGSLTWFMDGKQFFKATYQPGYNLSIPYYETFPFDQDFYMILNLAFGGSWGGAQGIDQSLTNMKMEVDYVRVYQRNYAVFDEASPSKPTYIKKANLKNTIYWTASADDGAIENYEIFVDGEYVGSSSLNQFTFDLNKIGSGAHIITIRAFDFVGRTSEFSDPVELTF